MPGIAFYYQSSDVDVWSGRGLDAWNYSCQITGDIDKMLVINETTEKLITPNSDIEFYTVETHNEAQKIMLGHIAYMVCPWNEVNKKTEIYDYDHSIIDWYIFGPAQGWGDTLNNSHNCITIPQNNQIACHAVHICTALMFHRYRAITWQ